LLAELQMMAILLVAVDRVVAAVLAEVGSALFSKMRAILTVLRKGYGKFI
jgi:hypothetical protein